MTPNFESMKKADLSRLETLEALIAEKRKQETFLAKLQERRAGTPEHVFKRLEDEYLTKLTDAQVKAAVEAESLSGGLDDDDAAVAEVRAKLEQLEEERVEMQLRAEVEEWDAKETQKKLTALGASISMAEKERDARTAVAERTRSLLTEARGGTPASGQPAVSGGGARPPMRPTTATLTGGPNFDELAFLNSVVGRQSTPSMPAIRESKPASPSDEIKEPTSAAPHKPLESPRPATPAAPSPSVAESVAAPTVPPSPAPPPPPVVVPAVVSAGVLTPQPPAQPSLELETPVPAPVASAPVAAPPPVAPPPVAPAPVAPAPAVEDEDDEPPSALGRPTPRTSQAVKTLKCAECGSMNYPTEWYCERCGGELAAL